MRRTYRKSWKWRSKSWTGLHVQLPRDDSLQTSLIRRELANDSKRVKCVSNIVVNEVFRLTLVLARSKTYQLKEIVQERGKPESYVTRFIYIQWACALKASHLVHVS